MSTSLSRIALLGASLALAANIAYATTFHRQIAASPHGEVRISNVAGSIVIRGWNKPAVSVTARLTSTRQRVMLRQRDGRIRIRITDGSRHCGWWSCSGRARARLEVFVPQDSEVHAAGVSAHITSRALAGVQHLSTVSGAIDAELGSSDDVMKSVSGSIRLGGSGRDGTLRVSTVSGDLTATNLAGSLVARTVNGRLTAQIVSAHSVRLHSVSGPIELNAHLAPGGRIESKTISGHQAITVIGLAGYAYEAKSFRGHIADCFGEHPKHPRFGPGSRLEGTLGAGHGRVRLKSLSGGISLCDH